MVVLAESMEEPFFVLATLELLWYLYRDAH